MPASRNAWWTNSGRDGSTPDGILSSAVFAAPSSPHGRFMAPHDRTHKCILSSTSMECGGVQRILSSERATHRTPGPSGSAAPVTPRPDSVTRESFSGVGRFDRPPRRRSRTHERIGTDDRSRLATVAARSRCPSGLRRQRRRSGSSPTAGTADQQARSCRRHRRCLTRGRDRRNSPRVRGLRRCAVGDADRRRPEAEATRRHAVLAAERTGEGELGRVPDLSGDRSQWSIGAPQ